MASGLPWKSRSHSAWLRTTTGSALPSAWMSDGWMRAADDRRHAEKVEGVAGQQDAAEALG